MWTGHVARLRKQRNAHRNLVGKLKGKRPPRRIKCGWEDNIENNISVIEWGGVDWIDLA
jgi:hypothetical protein